MLLGVFKTSNGSRLVCFGFFVVDDYPLITVITVIFTAAIIRAFTFLFNGFLKVCFKITTTSSGDEGSQDEEKSNEDKGRVAKSIEFVNCVAFFS